MFIAYTTQFREPLYVCFDTYREAAKWLVDYVNDTRNWWLTQDGKLDSSGAPVDYSVDIFDGLPAAAVDIQNMDPEYAVDSLRLLAQAVEQYYRERDMWEAA